MRILVDQDGVIADWGHRYGRSLDAHGEVARNIPRHRQQNTFDLHHERTPEEIEIIRSIMVEEGFYQDLRPIPGAKTALKSMVRAGHDVRIVTSPWVSNPTCASDKLNWIRRHYRGDWASRVIITSDKTLIKGDILIDDKPQVTGVETPEWEHVYFTQPYNITLESKRRINNWNEWESIVNG